MINHFYAIESDMDVFQTDGPSKYIAWSFAGDAQGNPGVYLVRISRGDIGSKDNSLVYKTQKEARDAAFLIAQALDSL